MRRRRRPKSAVRRFVYLRIMYDEQILVKQEPELDIVSDGEGFPLSHESGIADSQKSWMNERLDDKTCYSAIKIEAIETECDSRKKRSFQCYMCSKAYTTKQMLKLHISSIHMLLRPFKCELCSRAFYDKYTLTTHARIHSGERPYACPFCDKTFVQHSAMTKHKRVHTKEKPFHCEICSKSFSDRSSLIPHRKIHTGESERNRSFRCDVCDAGFIKNSHLVRHNQTKSHLKRVLECKIDVSEADYDASIYC